MKTLLVWFVLGLGFPLLSGLNCCCFAQPVQMQDCHAAAEKKSCHSNEPYSATEHSKCRCDHWSAAAVKENPLAGKSFVFRAASFAFTSQNIFSEVSNYKAAGIKARETDSHAPSNLIYLSSIHAQAPPLA